MEELENKELCAKCGGYCCKAGGCMYFVTDFENMKLEYLSKILETGRVSIKASLRLEMLPNEKIVVNPILYLKARNINHDIIDLVSFQTTCASLEETGCYFDFENRPSGGVLHVPRENGACYSAFDVTSEVNKYLPYQKILQRLVKRYTGMSIYEKIKEDIEALFIKILTKDFSDVMPEERSTFDSTWGLLIQAYSEQYRNAVGKVASMNILKRKLDLKNKKN